MKKIGIIICMLLLIGFFQGAVAYNETIETTNIETINISYGNSWTQPRNNAKNTGFSTSPAPNTNTSLWNFTYPYNDTFSWFTNPIVANNKLYISAYEFDLFDIENTKDSMLFCINPDTGEELWNITYIDKQIGQISYLDNKLYYSLNNTLYCSNSETRNQVWTYVADNDIDTPLSIEHNKIYFGTADKKLYCLNVYNGNLVWNYQSAYNITTPTAVSDGRIYFGAEDNKIYCLNAYNKNFLWTYEMGNISMGYPVIYDGKLFFTSYDKDLYCINAVNGEFNWNFTTPVKILTSPAVAYNKVYLAAEQLYCLDTDTGEVLWNHTSRTRDRSYPRIHTLADEPKENLTSLYSSPVVADGKVYLSAGVLWCFDALTGDLIWINLEYECLSILIDPAIANGKVYVPSWFGMVCFGDPASLEIGEITGGFRGVNAEIKNKGSLDAKDVEWEIRVQGGILNGINHKSEDTLTTIGYFESEYVNTYGRIFGLGPVDITITVSAPGLSEVTETMKGFVLGPYIFVL